MSGICSAHQHYEKGCRLCEAGREKFIDGEEVPEGYPEKVHAMIQEACEAEEKYGIDELEKYSMDRMEEVEMTEEEETDES